MGHQVSILTAGSLRNGESRLWMGGREVIELPYFPGRRLPFLSTFTEEWAFNLAARKWLLKNQLNYDLIHLQGRSGCLFLKNKKEVKVPVINTLHGLIEKEQQFSKTTGKSVDSYLHRKLANRLENQAIHHADTLIAVSDQMIRDFSSRHPEALEKTVKISNGVDPVREPNPAWLTDPNLLLFVGRLTSLKGIFELVEAMRLLPKNIQLVMVGDGEDRPALEQLVNKYNLGQRVLLTGGLASDKVQQWMHRCQALILPSYHETQGLVLLEANACGKPVIANAVGGMLEVVRHGENGLLLPDNDPQTIAQTIDNLFQNPKQAMLMGLQGKVLVQCNYTWKTIARTTSHLYATEQAKTSAESIYQPAFAAA